MDESRNIVTKLGRNKYLLRDSRQMWIARQRKNPKGGYDYVRITGYYSCFETLLNGMAREGALEAGGDDITEALASLAKLHDEIKDTAKKLGQYLDEKEKDNAQKN